MAQPPQVNYCKFPPAISQSFDDIALRRSCFEREQSEILNTGLTEEGFRKLFAIENSIVTARNELDTLCKDYNLLRRKLVTAIMFQTDSEHILNFQDIFGEKLVPLLALMLSDPYPELSESAAWYMGYLRSEETREALPHLIAALENGRPPVQIAVMRTLDVLDMTELVPIDVLSGLIYKTDKNLRTYALRQMEQHAEYAEQAAPEILGLFNTSGCADTRVQALCTLRTIKGDESVSVIGAFFRALEDPRPQIRYYAASMLLEVLGSDSSGSALRQVVIEKIQASPHNFPASSFRLLD